MTDQRAKATMLIDGEPLHSHRDWIEVDNPANGAVNQSGAERQRRGRGSSVGSGVASLQDLGRDPRRGTRETPDEGGSDCAGAARSPRNLLTTDRASRYRMPAKRSTARRRHCASTPRRPSAWRRHCSAKRAECWESCRSASRSVWLSPSCRGTIRSRCLPGRSRRRWQPAAPSSPSLPPKTAGRPRICGGDYRRGIAQRLARRGDGDSDEVGRALVRSPMAQMVAFTGSTESRIDIYREAAPTLKKLNLSRRANGAGGFCRSDLGRAVADGVKRSFPDAAKSATV